MQVDANIAGIAFASKRKNVLYRLNNPTGLVVRFLLKHRKIRQNAGLIAEEMMVGAGHAVEETSEEKEVLAEEI